MTAKNDNSSSQSERLNKYLALQLGISRREADNMIEEGRVAVNQTEARLGARFNPTDNITIDTRPLVSGVEYQYIVFNKPVGYVSSRKAQGDVPTIYALLPAKYHVLKPAGRLDKDSSGLMLLTNDGNFAYRMTHPKFNKTKQYDVKLDSELVPLHQQMISDYGIQLEDGTSQLHLERISDSSRKQWRVVMHEGRNRQIRRTFASLGYTVTQLHRTNFGNYSLDDIEPGKYKVVDIH